MFGRNRKRDVPVNAPDPINDVFMIHFVEHDRVVHVHAPSIEHAIACARTMFHVYTPRPDVFTRPLMYNDDRICVILYGNDNEYTCNIIMMPVYSHEYVPDDAHD